ncbi:hypothetical protein BBJ28_00011399, partial [Nothophytophthora sp. Chile5]
MTPLSLRPGSPDRPPPALQLSLGSLQLTPRVRELSGQLSGLPSPAGTPHSAYFHIDEPEVVPAKTYDLPVDPKQFDRATKIRPCNMLRPHMRIFHLSWMSGITGFIGWYAIPPLMPIIKEQLGLTDGQVLNSDIASTASTIFSRIASGPLLDRYGPQVVQSTVLWVGIVPIVCAAFVNSATSLLIVRFFIGLVGCVFVSSQYWTTITFARNVAGAGNAITGGLGLSGIGFAFLILPFVYEAITSSGHVSEDMGWRITIALPAVLMLIMGTVIRFVVDSCPTGDFQSLMNAKHQKAVDAALPPVPANLSGNANSLPMAYVQPSHSQQPKPVGLLQSFKIVLSDRNVLVMVAHYGACFGTELQLNNMGALYFYKHFTKKGCTDSAFCSLLSKTDAATVASSFGLMNLFARALGGLTSDAVNRRLGMRGRLCVQFSLLSVLSALVLTLSRQQSLGPCVALYILVAIAAQSSGGSTYGIVPYLNEQHTGTVNGLVGAGGNVGGVIFGFVFRYTDSYNTGLLYQGVVIFVCALLTLLVRFPHPRHQPMDVATAGDDPSRHGSSAGDVFKRSQSRSEAMEVASPALGQIAPSLTEASNEIHPTATTALGAELRQDPLPPSVGGTILPSTSLVQVAPLPLTTEFHAAKVLELGAMPPVSTQQHEEAYIPVALARAQLSKVVADMHAMKAEQVEKLGEILARYRGIEQDTRLRHEAYIRALKDRAETRLREAAERFEALEDAQKQREVLHSQEKQMLLDDQEQQRQRYVKAHEVWRCEFECALSAHEDEAARAQTMALNEIARVSRAAEVSGHRMQQQLRDELEMSGEDARSQAMRVRDQLHQARTALQTQHRAFLDRAAKLQRGFEAERQTERCLRELIDAVVERDRQETGIKYTRRLQAQLRTLEAKAKAAGSREEVLERRLEAARDRFERMEAQAVRETVELLVQAVVVTFQPPSRESVPVSQAVPKPQESWKEQENPDRVRTTGTVSELSLEQTKYESEVERSRERDGAVLRSKTLLHEAKEKLEALTKSKKAAKSAVKSWLAAFQAQYGREPAIEEKAQVKDKYLAFKQAEEAWSRHKADVSALKLQHRELVLRVEASSRWSALGSVIVKSPRPQLHLGGPDAEGLSSPWESSSASNSEKSSRASSQPPSTWFLVRDNSVDATATGAQSGVVAALEQEVQLLRQQLASVNAVQELKGTQNDELVASEASAIEESSTAELMTKSALSIEDDVVSTATDGEQEASAVALTQAEDRLKVDEAEALKLAEPKGVDDASGVRDQQMQHQRETLQAEITELTREIDARRAEKTRLELEIEQLRLHLELSEDQDSRVLESFPPSEAKASVETELEADEVTLPGHDEDFHEESNATEEQREQQDDNESLETEGEAEAPAAEPKDGEAEEQEDEQEEVEEPDEDEDQEVKEDAARSLQLRTMVEEAVARGKSQFNRGDKTRCYQTYVKCAEQCITELQQLHDRRRREEAAVVKRVLAESARLPAARGPLVLRKQLDVVLESCEQWLNAREEQATARQTERLVQKEAKASAKAVSVALRQQHQLEKKQHKAEQEEERKPHTKTTAPSTQSTGNATTVGGGKALEEVKQKLRALESKAKVDRVKISQLEAALAKAETQLASGGGGGGNASGGTGSAALERRVADMEKKNKKALDESEKAAKKEISALFQQLQAAQRTSQELQDQAAVLQKELGVVGGKAKQLGQLEEEVGELREQAALVAPLTSELREARTQFATLETSYREEQALRKKYYNQIEDMKGKIRVYARCRPMSG